MSEQTNEIQKLVTIATDMGFSAELRTKAIELLGRISTHDALRALLDMVANDELIHEERELALKKAGEILKSGH